MKNNKYKCKKRKSDSYFAQILIALMMLQMIPVAFASKSNNSPKRTLAKSTSKGKNTSTLASATDKKVVESSTAKSGNVVSKSSNNILAVNPSLQMPNDLIVVRHGSSINGSRIEGTIRVLLPESTSVNSGAVITGDILTPGTPNIVLNSNVKYNGTVEGTGNPQPTNYNVTLNSNATVRHVVTKTDAITISPVSPPPQPSGTRDISLVRGQSPGDFSTIRNLTVNSGYGLLTVPAGTYGNFAANSNSGFVFGVAGQSTVYNLQQLVLNSNTQLQILGVVTINVQGNVSLNSQSVMGLVESPISLALNIANGNLTLNSNSTMYGVVRTPNGQVSLNSNALLKGLITCDRLTANSNSKVQPLVADTITPVVIITSPTQNQTITTATTIVTGNFTDDSAVTLVKVNNVTAVINGNDYSATVPLTTGANTITVTATDVFGNVGTASVNVTRNASGNLAPVVDAGANQNITLPTNSVTLTGTVTDDGLPQPPSLSISWSIVSFPSGGTVSFGTPNAASTSASFNIAGTYILRLTASDSALSNSDDVTIIVNPAQPGNVAPSVNAGQDQVITLPNLATLQGQVSDDGLPNPPGQLTLSWSKVEGNGVVNFTSPNTTITQVSFSVAGTYTLRLTASDSALSTSDDIVVIANGAANQPPTVSAGDDRTILLPAVISLTATASDDGLPSSNLTVSWSKVTGPVNANVTFSQPNSLTTAVVFDLPGTYVLRITANDGELQSTDEITVNLTVRSRVIVYSNQDGFDAEGSISTQAGEKVLMVRNRTNEDITYVFTQGSQSISLLTLKGKNAFINVSLVAGTATLTTVEHPEWSLTINVLP